MEKAFYFFLKSLKFGYTKISGNKGFPKPE